MRGTVAPSPTTLLLTPREMPGVVAREAVDLVPAAVDLYLRDTQDKLTSGLRDLISPASRPE